MSLFGDTAVIHIVGWRNGLLPNGHQAVVSESHGCLVTVQLRFCRYNFTRAELLIAPQVSISCEYYMPLYVRIIMYVAQTFSTVIGYFLVHVRISKSLFKHWVIRQLVDNSINSMTYNDASR